jgi:hypothetical protein
MLERGVLMKTKITKPSTQGLIEFSREHLYYEIWMFYEVGKILAGSVQNLLIRNALLESFLMHARIILDFLDNKKLKDDDAIANDYLPCSVDLKLVMSPKSELLEDVHRRGHKELVHLSYKRLEVELENKKWEFLKMMGEVKQRIDLFLDKADRQLIHNRLRDYIKTL